jgi:predicted PurR-regulated permease PerM
MSSLRHDLTRSVLTIIVIVGLIALSLWILKPFLAAAIWAAMIVVATWPLLTLAEAKFGNRRAPAVAVMTLAMLLLLVLPLWLAIDTIVDHSGELSGFARRLAADGLPPPPSWVATLPVIGEKMNALWLQVAADGTKGLVTKVAPYAAESSKWALAQVGGLGGMLIQFLLVVIIAAIMYADGESAAGTVRRFGRRLGGERGENVVILAGQAIRGVALGVGVTAIVQTLLAGIGLAVAGVPFASLLSAVILMLCIAQLGPMLVLAPAVAWMYWTGDNGWATALLVWSLMVGSLDNFLRPLLIKRGADLPLLLIFAGVIGGMLGFGLIGIFVGPVALAVTYTLLLAWIEDALGKAESESSGAA